MRANEEYWFRERVGIEWGWWSLKADAPAPAAILQDIVDVNPTKYAFECANFAYFAQLYGVLSVLGASRFNAEMERRAITFNVYEHQTRFRKPLYVGDPMQIPVGADITLSVWEEILREVGRGPKTFSAMGVPKGWISEHLIKLSPDSYFGWGLPSEAPFDSLNTAYAEVILSFLTERRFEEFLDHTDNPMKDDARIDFVSTQRIKVTEIYGVVLP